MLHEKKGVVGWCGINDSDKGCKIDLKMQSAPAGQMEVIVHTNTKVYKLGMMEHSGKSAEKSFYHSISAKEIIGVSVEHMSTHYIAKGGTMLKVAPTRQVKKESVISLNKTEEPNKEQIEIKEYIEVEIEEEQPESKECIESVEIVEEQPEIKEYIESVEIEEEQPEIKEWIEGVEFEAEQPESKECIESSEMGEEQLESEERFEFIDDGAELSSGQLESEIDCGEEDTSPIRIARCEMRKCDWESIRPQEPVNVIEKKVEQACSKMEYEEPQNKNEVMIAHSEMRHCDCNCALCGDLSETEKAGHNELISHMIKDGNVGNEKQKLMEMMINADMSNTKVEDQLIGEYSGREGVLGQGVWWKVEQPGINDWHYLAGELMAKDGSRVRGIAMKAEVDNLPQHMVGYAKRIEEYYVVLIDISTGKLLPIDVC